MSKNTKSKSSKVRPAKVVKLPIIEISTSAEFHDIPDIDSGMIAARVVFGGILSIKTQHQFDPSKFDYLVLNGVKFSK